MPNRTPNPFKIRLMIFITSLENESNTKEIIIAHELKHISSKHYYDLVLLKIVDILFPFHPCLYFFKKDLINWLRNYTVISSERKANDFLDNFKTNFQAKK